MYRRILVVTGDQSWSDAPVQYAIALAAETGAELAILMALMPPLVAGTADIMACTLIVESMVAESESMLADLVVAAEQAGVSSTTHVRWGHTALGAYSRRSATRVAGKIGVMSCFQVTTSD